METIIYVVSSYSFFYSHKVFKRICAFFTALFFLFETFLIVPSKALAQPITEVNLPAFQFELNPELGTIESQFSGTTPASGQARPLIVHIQEAHGNIEGQKKIEGILHHLSSKYGIHTVLLEGTAFKLHPELAKFSSDPATNQSILEELTEKGIAAGAELFLAKNPNASAYGIEEVKPYVENGKAFKEVLEQKKNSDEFLRTLDQKLRALKGAMNERIRRFLDQNEALESSLATHLQYLKKQAKENLNLDLESPLAQFDWPMLVRVNVLGEMEKKFNQGEFEKQREKFLIRVKEELSGVKKGVEKGKPVLTLLNPFNTLLTQTFSSPAPANLESQIESLVASLPRDFDFKAYPQVNRFIGHKLLSAELKGDKLIKEIELLTEKITNKLIKTEQEQKIVEELKDYKLLKKLLSLELTANEYERIAYSVERIGEKRLNAISYPLNAALNFYRLAKERDLIMIRNIEKQLGVRGLGLGVRKTNPQHPVPNPHNNAVVVITGGFHSKPFQEYFTSKNYNYALITPKMSSIDGREQYVDSILKNFSPVSTSEWTVTPQVMSTRSELNQMGFRESEPLQQLRHRFQTAQRSELRIKQPSNLTRRKEFHGKSVEPGSRLRAMQAGIWNHKTMLKRTLTRMTSLIQETEEELEEGKRLHLEALETVFLAANHQMTQTPVAITPDNEEGWRAFFSRQKIPEGTTLDDVMEQFQAAQRSEMRFAPAQEYEIQDYSVYRLAVGNSYFAVSELGANVIDLVLGGKQVVWHKRDGTLMQENGIPTPGGIPFMFPWTSRIKDGKFINYRGQEINLLDPKYAKFIRKNPDPKDGPNVLHGMSDKLRWKVKQFRNTATFADIVLSFQTSDEPFIAEAFGNLKVEITYQLSKGISKNDEFSIITKVTNLDTQEVFLSFGHHPFFKLENRDDWEVKLNASDLQVRETDNLQVPLRQPLVSAAQFQDGMDNVIHWTPLKGRGFERIFTGFANDALAAEFRNPGNKETLQIFRDLQFHPYGVLWVPTGNPMLTEVGSFQPTTSSPDAINLDREGHEDANLIRIPTGSRNNSVRTLWRVVRKVDKSANPSKPVILDPWGIPVNSENGSWSRPGKVMIARRSELRKSKEEIRLKLTSAQHQPGKNFYRQLVFDWRVIHKTEKRKAVTIRLVLLSDDGKHYSLAVESKDGKRIATDSLLIDYEDGLNLKNIHAIQLTENHGLEVFKEYAIHAKALINDFKYWLQLHQAAWKISPTITLDEKGAYQDFENQAANEGVPILHASGFSALTAKLRTAIHEDNLPDSSHLYIVQALREVDVLNSSRGNLGLNHSAVLFMPPSPQNDLKEWIPEIDRARKLKNLKIERMYNEASAATKIPIEQLLELDPSKIMAFKVGSMLAAASIYELVSQSQKESAAAFIGNSLGMVPLLWALEIVSVEEFLSKIFIPGMRIVQAYLESIPYSVIKISNSNLDPDLIGVIEGLEGGSAVRLMQDASPSFLTFAVRRDKGLNWETFKTAFLRYVPTTAKIEFVDQPTDITPHHGWDSGEIQFQIKKLFDQFAIHITPLMAHQVISVSTGKAMDSRNDIVNEILGIFKPVRLTQAIRAAINKSVTNVITIGNGQETLAHLRGILPAAPILSINQFRSTAEGESPRQRRAEVRLAEAPKFAEITPTPTFFAKEGDRVVVKESAIRANMQHIKAMGVKYVMPVGATGESHKMGPQKYPGLRAQAIRMTTRIAKELGFEGIFTHVSGDTEEETIENALIAQEEGAHVIVIAPLYFLKNSSDIAAFIQRMRENGITLPIALYNNPNLPKMRAKVEGDKEILPEEVAKLKGVVFAIKNSGKQAYTDEYIKTGVPTFIGDESDVERAAAIRGPNGESLYGLVGSSTNFMELFLRIAETKNDEVRKALQAIITNIRPTLMALNLKIEDKPVHKIPQAIKYILSKIDPVMSDDVSLDDTPELTAEEKEAIDALQLEKIKFPKLEYHMTGDDFILSFEGIGEIKINRKDFSGNAESNKALVLSTLRTWMKQKHLVGVGINREGAIVSLPHLEILNYQRLDLTSPADQLSELVSILQPFIMPQIPFPLQRSEVRTTEVPPRIQFSRNASMSSLWIVLAGQKISITVKSPSTEVDAEALAGGLNAWRDQYHLFDPNLVFSATATQVDVDPIKSPGKKRTVPALTLSQNGSTLTTIALPSWTGAPETLARVLSSYVAYHEADLLFNGLKQEYRENILPDNPNVIKFSGVSLEADDFFGIVFDPEKHTLIYRYQRDYVASFGPQESFLKKPGGDYSYKGRFPIIAWALNAEGRPFAINDINVPFNPPGDGWLIEVSSYPISLKPAQRKQERQPTQLEMKSGVKEAIAYELVTIAYPGRNYPRSEVRTAEDDHGIIFNQLSAYLSGGDEPWQVTSNPHQDSWLQNIAFPGKARDPGNPDFVGFVLRPGNVIEFRWGRVPKITFEPSNPVKLYGFAFKDGKIFAVSGYASTYVHQGFEHLYINDYLAHKGEYVELAMISSARSEVRSLDFKKVTLNFFDLVDRLTRMSLDTQNNIHLALFFALIAAFLYSFPTVFFMMLSVGFVESAFFVTWFIKRGRSERLTQVFFLPQVEQDEHESDRLEVRADNPRTERILPRSELRYMIPPRITDLERLAVPEGNPIELRVGISDAVEWAAANALIDSNIEHNKRYGKNGKKKRFVSVFATGSTMIKIYEKAILLAQHHKEKKWIDFSTAVSFNLDENGGLAPDHIQSYRFFMNTNWFDPLTYAIGTRAFQPTNTYVFPGTLLREAYKGEFKSVARKIQKYGGVDFCYLGIGENGHFGFVEPANPIDAEFVKFLFEVPQEAISSKKLDALFAINPRFYQILRDSNDFIIPKDRYLPDQIIDRVTLLRKKIRETLHEGLSKGGRNEDLANDFRKARARYYREAAAVKNSQMATLWEKSGNFQDQVETFMKQYGNRLLNEQITTFYFEGGFNRLRVKGDWRRPRRTQFRYAESFFKDNAKLAQLNAKTPIVNSRLFENPIDTTLWAPTLGGGIVFSAKILVQAVKGDQKADAIFRTVYGPVTPEVPSSGIQTRTGEGQKTYVLVDNEGAADILDYLQYDKPEHQRAKKLFVGNGSRRNDIKFRKNGSPIPAEVRRKKPSARSEMRNGNVRIVTDSSSVVPQGFNRLIVHRINGTLLQGSMLVNSGITESFLRVLGLLIGSRDVFEIKLEKGERDEKSPDQNIYHLFLKGGKSSIVINNPAHAVYEMLPFDDLRKMDQFLERIHDANIHDIEKFLNRIEPKKADSGFLPGDILINPNYPSRRHEQGGWKIVLESTENTITVLEPRNRLEMKTEGRTSTGYVIRVHSLERIKNLTEKALTHYRLKNEHMREELTMTILPAIQVARNISTDVMVVGAKSEVRQMTATQFSLLLTSLAHSSLDSPKISDPVWIPRGFGRDWLSPVEVLAQRDKIIEGLQIMMTRHRQVFHEMTYLSSVAGHSSGFWLPDDQVKRLAYVDQVLGFWKVKENSGSPFLVEVKPELFAEAPRSEMRSSFALSHQVRRVTENLPLSGRGKFLRSLEFSTGEAERSEMRGGNVVQIEIQVGATERGQTVQTILENHGREIRKQLPPGVQLLWVNSVSDGNGNILAGQNVLQEVFHGSKMILFYPKPRSELRWVDSALNQSAIAELLSDLRSGRSIDKNQVESNRDEVLGVLRVLRQNGIEVKSGMNVSDLSQPNAAIALSFINALTLAEAGEILGWWTLDRSENEKDPKISSISLTYPLRSEVRRLFPGQLLTRTFDGKKDPEAGRKLALYLTRRLKISTDEVRHFPALFNFDQATITNRQGLYMPEIEWLTLQTKEEFLICEINLKQKRIRTVSTLQTRVKKQLFFRLLYGTQAGKVHLAQIDEDQKLRMISLESSDGFILWAQNYRGNSSFTNHPIAIVDEMGLSEKGNLVIEVYDDQAVKMPLFVQTHDGELSDRDFDLIPQTQTKTRPVQLSRRERQRAAHTLSPTGPSFVPNEQQQLIDTAIRVLKERIPVKYSWEPQDSSKELWLDVEGLELWEDGLRVEHRTGTGIYLQGIIPQEFFAAVGGWDAFQSNFTSARPYFETLPFEVRLVSVSPEGILRFSALRKAMRAQSKPTVSTVPAVPQRHFEDNRRRGYEYGQTRDRSDVYNELEAMLDEPLETRETLWADIVGPTERGNGLNVKYDGVWGFIHTNHLNLDLDSYDRGPIQVVVVTVDRSKAYERPFVQFWERSEVRRELAASSEQHTAIQKGTGLDHSLDLSPLTLKVIQIFRQGIVPLEKMGSAALAWVTHVYSKTKSTVSELSIRDLKAAALERLERFSSLNRVLNQTHPKSSPQLVISKISGTPDLNSVASVIPFLLSRPNLRYVLSTNLSIPELNQFSLDLDRHLQEDLGIKLAQVPNLQLLSGGSIETLALDYPQGAVVLASDENALESSGKSTVPILKILLSESNHSPYVVGISDLLDRRTIQQLQGVSPYVEGQSLFNSARLSQILTDMRLFAKSFRTSA